jgi:hypothetical protein
MAEYTATLPDGLTLPPGHKIDETDPRYRALVEAAKSEGLSQRAFSKILGLEAARVNADYAKAAKPAPASSQAAIPAPPDFTRMSTREKFHHALQREAAKREQPK